MCVSSAFAESVNSTGVLPETNVVQQNGKITGTVVDQTGTPVIGANVMVKGTTNGTITDFETEKDKILEQTIEEIGDKPIIIWCQFIHEIERLAEKFDGVGLTSKTKNRDDIIRQFKDGKIKLLFTHPQLLGKGLTFTNCNYNIYYSLSFSYEEFKQSQDRIHRIGQTNKCTYIILQAKNTIDEKIYSCLQKKGNAVDELYMEMGLKNE